MDIKRGKMYSDLKLSYFANASFVILYISFIANTNLLLQNESHDQVKEDEMGRTYSMNGGEEECI
jgi:hypothetical protein